MSDPQPNSAVIYRRRRVAAGSILALVVLAIVGLFMMFNDSDSSPSHNAQDTPITNETLITPHTQITASSGTTTNITSITSVTRPAFVPPCADSSIAITVNTDKPDYLLGEHPIFKALITNTSGQRCVRNIGTGMQQFQVLTLTGRHIWSNFDCSFQKGAKNQTFEPGQQIGFSLQWLGGISAPHCPRRNSLTLAPLGNYQVIASLGTVQSEPMTFNIR